MFQPGEEGHDGAKHMIAEGVLDGVDHCYALHCVTDLPVGVLAGQVGPMLAAADEFRITIVGRGGHGSAPHATIDPIPAACAIVPALSTMVAREIDTIDPVVLSVTHIESGTTSNVIPETALLEGTIRSLNEETRTLVRIRLEEIVSAVARSHRCESRTEMVLGSSPTIDHAAEIADLAAVAERVAGPGAYVDLPAPIMAAEDFSLVLEQRPGAMASLGVCPSDIEDPDDAPPLHSNRMRLNEEGLITGTAIHVGVALHKLGRLTG